MTLRFREYRPEDREACLAVFDSNVPRFFRDHERPEFAAFLDALPGPYFVIEEAGRVIACGGYADVGRLCWGMLARDRHGQGIGRLLLLARLRHWYERCGPGRMSLSTSHHTAEFFVHAGFIQIGFTPDDFAPGLHCCEMELNADAAWYEACRLQLTEDRVFEDATMTNSECRKVVEAVYSAFGAGDLPAVLELLSEDIEWRHPQGGRIPWGGDRRGRGEVAEFFKALLSAVEFEAFAPGAFIVDCPRVTVQGSERGRVKSNGCIYEVEWTHVFTISGDRVSAFQEYTDTAAIIEALESK